MKTDAEILKARMEGAKAALEGLKLDANTYAEDDDLHFAWLDGWASARFEIRRGRNPNSTCRGCWGTGSVEIQSGPYYRKCEVCGGTGQNH